MNALIQADTLTVGASAQMVNPRISTIVNCHLQNSSVSSRIVCLDYSIPSIGGTSISAIAPEFAYLGGMTTSIWA